MPEAPGKRYESGTALNVRELIVGMNSKDGTSQYYAQVPFVTNASNGNWTANMVARWGEDLAPQVMQQYDYHQERFNGSVQAAFVQADSDFVVACPALRMARSAATGARAAQVFVYQLSHYKKGIDVAGELAMIDDKDVIGWASHGADIPFVFGQTSGPDLYWNTKIDVPFTAQEEALSAAVRGYWTRFSARGTPGAEGWPTWPSLVDESCDGGCLLNLQTRAHGGATAIGAGSFKHDDCAFWERVGGDVPGARAWRA